MKIDNGNATQLYNDISKKYANKLDKKETLSAKEITNSYIIKFQQNVYLNTQEQSSKQVDTFSLADIGYSGKSIGKLSQSEAKNLVSENGFFGIKKTSERIANFVINGAGDDIDKLKAGKDGILQGFNEAQKLWGGKLPEISYNTLDKAIKMIDERLNQLNTPIIDTKA